MVIILDYSVVSWPMVPLCSRLICAKITSRCRGAAHTMERIIDYLADEAAEAKREQRVREHQERVERRRKEKRQRMVALVNQLRAKAATA